MMVEASDVIAGCLKHDLRVATAESCTGGLIAAALTDVPGSSAVFDRGFVTYSNEAKAEMLGVAPSAIEREGAVSSEVAGRMAMGAVAHSNADLAVAVTGIAGPGGGTPDKPVGLVYLAIARRFENEVRVIAERRLILDREFEADGRAGVRAATVRIALQTLAEVASLERP